MIRLVPRVCVLLLALALVFPAAAAAHAGDGPYTPFPEDPTARALDFVSKLNKARLGGDSSRATPSLTLAQLTKGVDLAPAPARAGGKKEVAAREVPFRQAGVATSSAPPSPATWPFAALAGVLGAAAVAVAWGQRRRPG